MIKIGICGYGNLGKGVEAAVYNSPDTELAAVFTRRAPESLVPKTEGVKVLPLARIAEYKDKIDVIINCGGSAVDLPVTTPLIARDFCVVDSFDNHAKIPEHFANVDANARAGGSAAVISVGWDPGLFSLARLYMNAALPCGSDVTFWGRGVSQGHSEAIRRIDGVVDAIQYTVPVTEAVERVQRGEQPELSARQKHTRLCFVAVKDGADRALVEQKIKTMPNYFADYDTTVTFVTIDELKKNHSGMPHGGRVIRSGYTGFARETKHTAEFSLKLESNPEFTGSVLTAYARAAYRLSRMGETGCRTAFDIAPALLFPENGEFLISHLL